LDDDEEARKVGQLVRVDRSVGNRARSTDRLIKPGVP
jgi:hypothetical protein